MKRALGSAPIVLVLVALTGVACGSDRSPSAAPPPPDELEAIPFPSTKILSVTDLTTLEAAPDGTLTFTVAPDSLQDAKIGTVIVAGMSPTTPLGLLRVVTKVERSGDELVLQSAAAPIQLAFRKLHARIQRTTADLGSAKWNANNLGPSFYDRAPLSGDVHEKLPLDFLLFDADGDSKTTNDQVAIKGAIGGGFRYDLSIDVDWGDVFDLPALVESCVESIANILEGDIPSCSLMDLLPEVKLSFEVDPRIEADLGITGSASLSYEKSFDIATISLAPIPLGPLVFLPSAEIIAKVEGSAAAGFSVGASGIAEFQTKLVISSKSNGTKIVPFKLLQTDFSADSTQVTLSARGKVGLGARLNLQLYGIVGPNAAARAYAEVAGNIDTNPCWELRLGLEGEIGVKVTSPTLPVLGHVTLLEWTSPPFTAFDEALASGDCLPIPKGPQLPPGSGPDATSLANPSFSPWDASFDDSADDGVVHTPTGEGRDWTNLSLAIDGRYVAAGSRNEKLVKFDDDGALIWSKSYRRLAIVPPLRLLRVAHTSDAAMIVVATAPDGEGPSVMKIGQSGGVIFRKTVSFSQDGPCPSFDPVTVLRDGASGFFVVGSCLGGQRAAVIHLDQQGFLIGSRLLGDAEGTRSITPTAATVVEGDVVVLGHTSVVEEGTSMFAVRLGETGDARFSMRYRNCEAPKTLTPLAARTRPDGQVVIVGSSGNSRTGMLAQLRVDGTVAFAGFQTYDGDSYYFLNDLAELPTTGFVAAASTLDHLAPSGGGGIALVNLDATGRPLWAKRYLQSDGREMSFGSVLLTNDGGAVIAGMTAGHSEEGLGGIGSFKVIAKDGSLETASGVTAEALPVSDLPCAMGDLAWPVVVETGHAQVASVPTLVDAQ